MTGCDATPMLKEGDRTDFTVWDTGARQNICLVGVVEAVYPGPILHGLQMSHAYRIRSNNEAYRVFEQDVSTPYGEHDD